MQGLERPGLLTPYDVDAERIVDLCDPNVCDDTVLFCPWKTIARIEKRRPPDLGSRGAPRRSRWYPRTLGPAQGRCQPRALALESGGRQHPSGGDRPTRRSAA